MSPRRKAALAGGGISLVLLVAGSPRWIATLWSGLPDPQPFDAGGQDARLVVWILAWVAHALGTAPSHLFDANIFHPAGGMLTGSEHFLGAQVLFGPLYALTGNPIFATNAIAIMTYAVAGAATAALVAGWGAGLFPSTVAGVLAAFGAFRVPVDIRPVVHEANALPACLWLALDLYREQPRGWARAGLVAVAFLVVVFWSYYMALLGIVVALLFVIERRAAGRTDGLGRLLAVLAACSLSLAAFSVPYFERAAAVPAIPLHAVPLAVRGLGVRMEARYLAAHANWGGIALLALAAPVLWTARPPGGRLAAALVVVGVAGPFVLVGVPEITSTPLRFFRYPWRPFVLADVGIAALAGYGVHLLTARTGRRWLRAVVAGIAILAAVHRMPGLGIHPITTFPTVAPPVYAWLIEHGNGEPLLEWPYPAILRDMIHQSDAMVASTFHWLPVLNGWTGYPPPWRASMSDIASRLPSSDALHDLVEMTHLRWILWHGPGVPPFGTTGSPELSFVGWFGSSALYRVEIDAADDVWRDALRSWRSSAVTYLGTPRRALDAGSCRSTVAPAAPDVDARGRVRIATVVANPTSTPWPARGWSPDPRYTISLESRWTCADGYRDTQPGRTPLPRDLRPGEHLAMTITSDLPKATPPCRLELAVVQEDGCVLEPRTTVSVASPPARDGAPSS